jgi:hypothetical protein
MPLSCCQKASSVGVPSMMQRSGPFRTSAARTPPPGDVLKVEDLIRLVGDGRRPPGRIFPGCRGRRFAKQKRPNGSISRTVRPLMGSWGLPAALRTLGADDVLTCHAFLAVEFSALPYVFSMPLRSSQAGAGLGHAPCRMPAVQAVSTSRETFNSNRSGNRGENSRIRSL